MKPVLAIEISRLADADFVSIIGYGSEMFGWERAETYVAGFDDSFELLAEYPEIGVLHSEFRPSIRSFPHGSHRIFYDIAADRIIGPARVAQIKGCAAAAGMRLGVMHLLP